MPRLSSAHGLLLPEAGGPPRRLGLHHLAHLRAVAQGLSVTDSARHYLAAGTPADAAAAHRDVVEQVSAVLRRRGDGRWRLLRLDLAAPAAGASETAPTLEEWAEAEGVADWSMSELVALYAERYGSADRSGSRRQARLARLSRKRLALLNDLETLVVLPAQLQDRLDGWLSAPLVGALLRIGDVTLEDLQRRISRGGRWWSRLPSFGPVKAARLAGLLSVMLGASALRVWSAPAPDDADHATLRAWRETMAGAPATAVQYAREADRFLLWCSAERSTRLQGVSPADCTAYMTFLGAIPEPWISRRRVARFEPGWAPFKGQLSERSREFAASALHAFFKWMVEAQVLTANPWDAVDRNEAVPRHDAGSCAAPAEDRAFSPALWKALVHYLDRCDPSLSTHRLRWLCTFVEATGLSAAELLRARREHVRRVGSAWVISVNGRGGKERVLKLPARALRATREYFQQRDVDFDDAPPSTPLLALLDEPLTPCGYRALHETFTRFVRRAVAASPGGKLDRSTAMKATAHWLRNTHALNAARRNVRPATLQKSLGYARARSTGKFYPPALMEGTE